MGSLSPRDSGSLSFTAEGTSGDGVAYNVRQWRLEMDSEASHGSGSPRGCRLFEAAAGGAEDDGQASSTGSSSGPRRALHPALEDVSSRSSLLGPDADSSSTPGSKEGSRWGPGAVVHRMLDAGSMDRRSRGQNEGLGLFPKADDAGAGVSFPASVEVDASELPLSFMSEPALACLPGAPLPPGLVELSQRCARSNATAAASAAAAAAAAAVVVGTPGGSSSRKHLGSTEQQSVGSQGVQARRRYIDAVRSMERRKKKAAAPGACAQAAVDSGSQIAAGALAVVGGTLAGEAHREEKALGCQPAPESQGSSGGVIAQGEGRACLGTGDSSGVSSEACGFEDRLSRGVTGLLRQYREVVEGGQRSPVDFVVRAVPEVSQQGRRAVRSMLLHMV